MKQSEILGCGGMGFRLGLGWVQNSRGGGVKRKGGKRDGIYHISATKKAAKVLRTR